MKNQIYIIKDSENEIYIDCFIAISDKLAKKQIETKISQSIYLLKNSTQLTQKANILTYLSNSEKYTLIDKDDNEIIKFSDLLKNYENDIKIDKTDVANEIKKEGSKA